MDEMMSRGLSNPPNGFRHSELVTRRYEELLERGARQGWLMSSADIHLGNPIGAGTFGQTFAATWRGTQVSFLSLSISCASHVRLTPSPSMAQCRDCPYALSRLSAKPSTTRCNR